MKCAAHPQEEIVGPCARCGDFVCGLDSEARDEGRVCFKCGRDRERAEVEAFIDELRGRPDNFAVAYLLVGILLLFAGMQGGSLQETVACVASSSICAAFFFRLKWARWIVVALPALVLVFSVAAKLPPLASITWWLLLLGASAITSTRNRLFFKIDLPETERRAFYDRAKGMEWVRAGHVFSFIAILFPPAILGSIALYVVGLIAVKTRHVRRSRALAEVAAGLFGGVLLLVIGGLLMVISTRD